VAWGRDAENQLGAVHWAESPTLAVMCEEDRDAESPFVDPG